MSSAVASRKPARRLSSDLLWAILFTAPALVLCCVFVIWPLLRSVYLTFFDYSFLTEDKSFAGVGNYLEWAQDSGMWHSLWISVKFFGFYVPTSMVLALAVALLIDRLAVKYLPSIYRTIFYFPVVLPAAIVFQMWLWIYDPTLGVLALTGQAIGFEDSVSWLGDPDLALGSLALMSVWRLLGETVIFFLVGLAAIPRDYLEAARIDGASEWMIIRKIIVPLLMPIIFLVFVLRLKVLEMINEPLFMTGGGPIDATLTYGLKAFYLFNSEDRIGYANTWFIMMALIAVAAAVFAGRQMRRYQG